MPSITHEEGEIATLKDVMESHRCAANVRLPSLGITLQLRPAKAVDALAVREEFDSIFLEVGSVKLYEAGLASSKPQTAQTPQDLALMREVAQTLAPYHIAMLAIVVHTRDGPIGREGVLQLFNRLAPLEAGRLFELAVPYFSAEALGKNSQGAERSPQPSGRGASSAPSCGTSPGQSGQSTSTPSSRPGSTEGTQQQSGG